MNIPIVNGVNIPLEDEFPIGTSIVAAAALRSGL